MKRAASRRERSGVIVSTFSVIASRTFTLVPLSARWRQHAAANLPDHHDPGAEPRGLVLAHDRERVDAGLETPSRGEAEHPMHRAAGRVDACAAREQRVQLARSARLLLLRELDRAPDARALLGLLHLARHARVTARAAARPACTGRAGRARRTLRARASSRALSAIRAGGPGAATGLHGELRRDRERVVR